MTTKKPPPLPDGRPRSPVTDIAFPRFSDDADARNMVVMAQERAAMIERQAYQEGFAQGETAGRRMGLAQAAPGVEAIARLVERFDQLMKETLAAMEPEIVRMVLAIAERVIHTVIAEDHTVVQRVVQAALKELDDRWAVTIKVNPGDYEFLEATRAQWLRVEYASKVTLTADASVEPGGCIAQTPQGLVDATLKTILARVARLGADGGE